MSDNKLAIAGAKIHKPVNPLLILTDTSYGFVGGKEAIVPQKTR